MISHTIRSPFLNELIIFMKKGASMRFSTKLKKIKNLIRSCLKMSYQAVKRNSNSVFNVKVDEFNSIGP